MSSEVDLGSGRKVVEVETDERGRATLGSEYADEELVIEMEDAREVEEYDVYFHRLGLAVTRRALLDIFMERRMAIDWDVGGLKNPYIYEEVAKDREQNTDKKGKGVLSDAKHLLKLSNEGGLVAAYFPENTFSSHGLARRSLDQDVILIGKVLPDTKIQPREYSDKEGYGRYLNTLKMVDTIDVYEHQDDERYSELFENHPRGTIRNWNAQADLVREAYEVEREQLHEYY